MNIKMEELVDQLVIESLKESYKINNNPNPVKIMCYDDYIGPNEKLLDAITTLLGYYMPECDFIEWYEKRNK